MATKNIASTAYKAAFFIVAGFGFFLTATAVQAGFEWVPAAAPASAPKAAEETATAPAVPAPEVQAAEPVSPVTAAEPTLPMPGEPPAQEPAAASLQPKPLDGTSDMEMPQPVAEAGQSPQQMQQLPTPLIEAPEGQSKIKVLEVTPAPEEAGQAEILTKMQPAPQPEQQPGLAPPPPAMKVIMPEDAPATAMESTPNSQKLTIAPYPQAQKNLEQEQAQQQDAVSQDAAAAEQLSPVPQTEENASSEPAQGAQNSGNVVGFGSDIPLALALREVVPTDYAFSFGPGVNPGYRVSWTGDKPWKDVVDEMVAPLDMVAHIRGNVVHISKAGQAPAEPEQHSSAAPVTQEADQMTQLDGEAVPLMLHPVRSNISDPGETPQAQPSETVSRIEEISSSIEPQQPELQSIEPASSNADAPEDISEPAIQSLLEDISTASPEAPVWQANKGDSLKTVLDQWSTKAGIELIWDVSHDYSISSDISTDESFEAAVKIITANTTEGEQPQVKFLKDAETNELGIVVVKDKAETAAAQSSSI